MFRPATYRFFQLLLRAFFTFLFRLRVEGISNIPTTGGCILISNHPTWLDPPLIAAVCPRAIRIVAKERLFHLPVIRLFLRGLGCIPVKDDPQTGKPTADLSVWRRMIKVLKSGEVLLIYPEGGRSDRGKVRDFEGGAAILAGKAQVPIVPMAICGAYEAWPEERVVPRPHPICIRIGAPVVVQPSKDRRNETDWSEELRNRVVHLMGVEV